MLPGHLILVVDAPAKPFRRVLRNLLPEIGCSNRMPVDVIFQLYLEKSDVRWLRWAIYIYTSNYVCFSHVATCRTILLSFPIVLLKLGVSTNTTRRSGIIGRKQLKEPMSWVHGDDGAVTGTGQDWCCWRECWVSMPFVLNEWRQPSIVQGYWYSLDPSGGGETTEWGSPPASGKCAVWQCFVSADLDLNLHSHPSNEQSDSRWPA